jgi:hypothetical protein
MSGDTSAAAGATGATEPATVATPAETAPATAPATAPVQPAATPAAAAPARPDYIEEKFWDAHKGSVRLEELAKSYREIQAKQSMRTDDLRKAVRADLDSERLGRRPAAADKYVPQPPKGALPEGVAFKPDVNNPLFKWWGEHAWNAGLSQEDYERGIGVYLESLGYGLPDPQEEMKKLGDNAQERVTRAHQWAKGNLTDGSYKMLEQLASTAQGVQLVEEMVRLTAGHAQGRGPGSTGYDAPSLESLQQKMKDPRYHDPYKRDPAFVREIEDGFKRLVAAGGGRKA